MRKKTGKTKEEGQPKLGRKPEESDTTEVRK